MAILKALSLGLSGVLAGGVAIGAGGKLLLGSGSELTTGNQIQLSDRTAELEEQSNTITQLQNELDKLIQQKSENEDNYNKDLSSRQDELKKLRESTSTEDLSATKKQLEDLKRTYDQNSEDALNLKISGIKAELEKIQQNKKTYLEEKNQAQKEHKELSEKLEQMKRLEKIFKEFLKDSSTGDQIKSIEEYKAKLLSVITRQREEISAFRKDISDNLARLFDELRSGKEVKVIEADLDRSRLYISGYKYKVPIVGSTKEEEEFIKTLTDVFEQLKNK
ncbi:hypothetical protein OVS_03820 [Mycoplasma ovis str. Michigan]|uniref:Chromosome partition protein Smc n=1 Tax=Mycoplasma ovis str. Michigan TaxID=1415773 RepID=A0ABN4BLZ7_9MOLU|nr:hypothetical protein [Mycoplasma ovis]AHC40496.1 hypothetical protein OVS_03820 [Mycoplasma ovis str. Michigan]